MKKTLAMLTAMAMTLSLAACGGSKPAETTAAPATTAAAETKAEETKAEETKAEETKAEETKAEESKAEAGGELVKPDGFPTETITLICPFSAGGGTDIGARTMAKSLAKVLGVNVVVENKPGSGGWLAWTDLITGDYSDGYTLGLVNHNFVFGAIDPENPREYTLDNIQPLVNQVIDNGVLAIRGDEDRFTDIDTFIAYAKENPIMISAQATGITDGEATKAEFFNRNFGTQITVIPVDGASDSRSMFLSKDTDVFFADISDINSYIKDGQMKALCVFNKERSSFLPDVPTIEEATGKSLRAFACRGYFYPAGVDKEKAEFMTQALLKAMEDEEYKSEMEALGLQLDDSHGDAYKELLQSQLVDREAVWSN